MTWVNCKHFNSEGLGGSCSHGAAPRRIFFWKSMPADCILAYGPVGKDPRVAHICTKQEKLDDPLRFAPPMPPVAPPVPVFTWLLVGGKSHGLTVERAHNDMDRIRVVEDDGEEEEYFRTVYMHGAAFYRIAIHRPSQNQFEQIPWLLTDHRVKPI